MTISYAHTFYCDRPGCRSHLTITGTRNAAHARTKARQEHGWRIGRQDLCPNEPKEQRRG